jgi:hypothetical protein
MPPRERLADPLTERRVALIRDGAILVDAARLLLGTILHEAGQRAVADLAEPDAPLRCCGMSCQPAMAARRGVAPFPHMLRSLR